ncbi:CRISPR-associated endonuclease Cas1 [Actinobacillus vicugnae]|uniref:CRISPR-associated endonuclease Cas2 n=1 Tax=Actinobacillus vicugnae TaxID=2573093 RepID=UPI00123FF377|nr:CRISPR-associated endonuclease Cas2 [Actinobacillus vicugnae]
MGQARIRYLVAYDIVCSKRRYRIHKKLSAYAVGGQKSFNAMLSLGYTLLHSETVLALYGVGLDPYVGFYHSLDYGRESLACDVMEILRP